MLIVFFLLLFVDLGPNFPLLVVELQALGHVGPVLGPLLLTCFPVKGAGAGPELLAHFLHGRLAVMSPVMVIAMMFMMIAVTLFASMMVFPMVVGVCQCTGCQQGGAHQTGDDWGWFAWIHDVSSCGVPHVRPWLERGAMVAPERVNERQWVVKVL